VSDESNEEEEEHLALTLAFAIYPVLGEKISFRALRDSVPDFVCARGSFRGAIRRLDRGAFATGFDSDRGRGFFRFPSDAHRRPPLTATRGATRTAGSPRRTRASSRRTRTECEERPKESARRIPRETTIATTPFFSRTTTTTRRGLCAWRRCARGARTTRRETTTPRRFPSPANVREPAPKGSSRRPTRRGEDGPPTIFTW
jgi:hypothetical protein